MTLIVSIANVNEKNLKTTLKEQLSFLQISKNKEIHLRFVVVIVLK